MQKPSSKVAVLMGGIGREREVSLQSGACVLEALAEAGYAVVGSDVTPDALSILDDPSVHVFFTALHGEFGEDGQLQAIMEQRQLRYTGSRPAACRAAFDKMVSKAAFKEAGVDTPEAVVFNAATDARRLAAAVQPLGDPLVIKPIRQGSSVGVQIVHEDDTLWARCCETLEMFGSCMVEKYISGRELTVGILDGRPLPVIEIQVSQRFYDYQAKYLDDTTRFLFDSVDARLSEKLQIAALACYHGLALRHLARVDFLVTPERHIYALEVNTIPGLTSHSLLPKAAARAHLSMGELCARIVEAAASTQAAQAVE